MKGCVTTNLYTSLGSSSERCYRVVVLPGYLRQLHAASLLQVHSVLGLKLRGSLASSFSAWRAAAAAYGRRKQLLRAALGRLSQRCLSAAFAAWREAAARRALARKVTLRLHSVYATLCPHSHCHSFLYIAME